MEEDQRAILEILSRRDDWRAPYGYLKKEAAVLRMNHVRLIAVLRELEEKGQVMKEPVSSRGGRRRYEYALPTEDLRGIRASEWAPEQVLARLRGLDRQPTDNEVVLFQRALITVRARGRRPAILDTVEESIAEKTGAATHR